ncbi:MAG: response regulator [Verrucomicrobia bacterium]|mgnify:FL=1|jgi:two-component system, OmpR family, alkaline phosphatase synthesis response regulator PhoP|nr:response regulator [Verrucomicrobiota bacterium]MBT7067375.1 response regulator [Verrucomicrobiota bacterium]MBT7700010.1 response regulator [Verrucomicrobiota bacterium]
MKIYMVDDDIDLVMALTAALQAKGYEVASQNDEREVDDKIRQFNPDLIILDVMLPEDDMAGFKIARSIRHHDTIKNKPVIMLSGINTEGNLPGKITNRDIDDIYLPITRFLDKPVDPRKLIETIEELTA